MADKTNNNKRITAGTVIAACCLVLGVATVMAALMGTVYCSRAELAQVKEEVKEDMSVIKLKVAQTNWKIQTMQAQVENVERRQEQMGENIVKLLIRFRVRPVAKPVLKPLPDPFDIDAVIDLVP